LTGDLWTPPQLARDGRDICRLDAGPTSWNYNPNRQMAGTFVNYSGGDFQSFRFSSTTGLALSRINWRPERQFAFFENTILYKTYLSIYHSLEADDYRIAETPQQKGLGVSRSF